MDIGPTLDERTPTQRQAEKLAVAHHQFQKAREERLDASILKWGKELRDVQKQLDVEVEDYQTIDNVLDTVTRRLAA